jgi:hypothetical protein
LVTRIVLWLGLSTITSRSSSTEKGIAPELELPCLKIAHAASPETRLEAEGLGNAVSACSNDPAVNASVVSNDKLLWLVSIHLTFVISALMLSVMDRIIVVQR